MTSDAQPSPPLKPALSTLEAGQFVRGRHRYRLHQRIGSGSFGTVWAALCVEPDNDAPDVPPRTVAIKFFDPSADKQATEFIRRELAALISMRSERIPRVYDWAVNNRLSFFVMALYRHGSVADVLRKGGSLDDDECWLLLVDLLRALQVAHRAGILHLDIKPANIMRDGSGGYRLLDFGISQAIQVGRGSARTVGAGSVGYQAPEQRRLELDDFDTRTDLWAVGATVWALRTGFDLRKHTDKINVDASGKQASLPPLSSECLSVSARLDEILMHMLCADRSARPGGAAAVLEQVKLATGINVPDAAHGASGLVRRDHNEAEVLEVIDAVMDPMWSALLKRADFSHFFACFEDGDYLCKEGDATYEAFLLLQGSLCIEKGGRKIAIDKREGTFVGEISTLTGTPRAASVRAIGRVWVCLFNAAEFERVLAAHPSVGIRLVKLMAQRLLRSG
ncbi:MAG: hypothetical protein ACI8W7_000684 [Gammaproteobacteria bacterium]